MRKVTITLAVLVLLVLACQSPALAAEVKVKDVAKVRGVRSNQLLGYGLVAGLQGTGDDPSNIVQTKYAIQSLMRNQGIELQLSEIDSEAFASVLVTADLPPFVKPGDTIDVSVSTMGDATSLQGGTLIRTALRGMDNNIYAMAQGPLSLGAFAVESASGASQQKNFLTVGRMPGGATVEREVSFDVIGGDEIQLMLNNPDFTTAFRMAEAINALDGLIQPLAEAVDPATVRVTIPEGYRADPVAFVSLIEGVKFNSDLVAKVVINERTGTIVLGGEIMINPVAIAHGSLEIRIDESFGVSQPEAFSEGGSTVITPDSDIMVNEGTAVFVQVSTKDLVSALNALGVSPRDVVAIFQAIKAAGALQAELVIM